MIDFDYILTKIGTFGRYQFVVSVVLSYCAIANGMNEYASIFFAYFPEFRCSVPLFENSTRYPNLTEEQILNLTTPTDATGKAIDPCVRFGYDLSECSKGDFKCVNKDKETIPCDNGYYYGDSLFENTIVTEFHLVCNREVLGYVSTSVFLVGNIIGSLAFAHMADRLGRKPVMFISNAGLLVFALATSFCRGIELYSVGRFFQGFFGSACFNVAYVHVLEIVGNKWRGLLGIVIQTFYIIGYVLWSGIAYQWRDWHDLQFSVFIVQLPFTIACIVIPESPRWLFATDKEKKGKEVSKTVARWNGTDVAETLWTDATVIAPENSSDTEQTTYSIRNMFLTPGIRRVTIKSFCLSFIIGLVYYGVSLNLGSVGGNLFLNNLFGGLFELVSYLICGFLMNFTGRRPLLCGLFILCGISLAIYSALLELGDSESVTTASSVLVQVGKGCSGGAYAVGITFLTELFPTILRNTASAVCFTVAQVGAVVGPAFILLQTDIPWLPNSIFAIVATVGGLVTLTLPETNGLDLTETIEEAELFYAGKSFRRRLTVHEMDSTTGENLSAALK